MTKMSYWKIIASATACFIIAAAVIVPVLLKDRDGSTSGLDSFTLSRSSGNIQVRYIDDIPDTLSMSSAILAEMTADELFNKYNTDIFSGTIQSVHNIEIAFDADFSYMGMVTIIVEEVFRGSCVPGDIVSILTPNTFNMNMWVEDTSGLEKMEAGITGIFMPFIFDENGPYSFLEQNGAKLYWRDVAQYRFLDVRYVFLETQEGLVFDRYSYTGIKNATTIDEVRQYIITMLDKKN